MQSKGECHSPPLILCHKYEGSCRKKWILEAQIMASSSRPLYAPRCWKFLVQFECFRIASRCVWSKSIFEEHGPASAMHNHWRLKALQEFWYFRIGPWWPKWSRRTSFLKNWITKDHVSHGGLVVRDQNPCSGVAPTWRWGDLWIVTSHTSIVPSPVFPSMTNWIWVSATCV